MLHAPNPILNDEEQELLNDAPEECLRRAVQRAALSLDEIVADLSPRIAAAVRCIATGERSLLSDPAAELTRGIPSEGLTPSGDVPLPHVWAPELARSLLTSYSQLTHLMDEQTLTSDEAMETAQTIDHILGRYTTGTRYAAP